MSIYESLFDLLVAPYAEYIEQLAKESETETAEELAEEQTENA